MGLYRTGVSSSGGGSITVDDQLSTTSENPVQNKVITNALNNTNTAVSGKQDTLTAGSGINISGNTISIDSSSMSGYQKYISFETSAPSNWEAGVDGELRYYVQTGANMELHGTLYRYTDDILIGGTSGWYKVYETDVLDSVSSPTVHSALSNIVISDVDIGEGQPLPAGTLYLVVQ